MSFGYHEDNLFILSTYCCPCLDKMILKRPVEIIMGKQDINQTIKQCLIKNFNKCYTGELPDDKRELLSGIKEIPY